MPPLILIPEDFDTASGWIRMAALTPTVHYVGGCSSESKASKQSKLRKKSKRVPINLIDSESLLDNLFTVEGSDVFRETHFRRNPFVSRGSKSNLSELKKLLFDLDIAELLENSASDRIHVWLSQNKSISTERKALDSMTVEDHNQAMKLYWAGHSIYCRAPLELERSVVPRLLHEIGLGVTGSGTDKYRRGEIELFLSREGHATDFHTDFQENFTIQITGSKKWIFRKSTAAAPLRGCTPHFANSDVSNKIEKKNSLKEEKGVSEQQLKVLRLGDPTFSADQYSQNKDDECTAEGDHYVILNPGDVMYHPADPKFRAVLGIALSVTTFPTCLSQSLMDAGPVISGNKENAQKSLQVIRDLLADLPAILKGLDASDFLPAPCLDASHKVNEEEMEVEIERTRNSEVASAREVDNDEVLKNGKNGNFKQKRQRGIEQKNVEGDEEEEGGVEEQGDEEEEGDIEEDGDEEENRDDDEEEDEEEEDRDDDEEEEEEEEEEGNHNISPPIHAASFSLTIFPDDSIANPRYRINPLARIIAPSDTQRYNTDAGQSSSSDNVKKNEEKVEEEEEEEDKVFVVHVAYGNETFESVLRQTVIVPYGLIPATLGLMALMNKHQLNRQAINKEVDSAHLDKAVEKKRKRADAEISSDIPWSETSHIRLSQLIRSLPSISSKLTQISASQVLQAFEAAGALTHIPKVEKNLEGSAGGNGGGGMLGRKEGKRKVYKVLPKGHL